MRGTGPPKALRKSEITNSLKDPAVLLLSWAGPGLQLGPGWAEAHLGLPGTPRSERDGNDSAVPGASTAPPSIAHHPPPPPPCPAAARSSQRPPASAQPGAKTFRADFVKKVSNLNFIYHHDWNTWIIIFFLHVSGLAKILFLINLILLSLFSPNVQFLHQKDLAGYYYVWDAKATWIL